ncbi:MAG: homocysteine S-methyltransferase family protein [Caldilineaceae bacterium]|nr:homocysteine S-methyltransferase family protein [Caldilineaceae bacterium]
MTTIIERLEDDRAILMDGATGTELESRGVSMHGIAWSGIAVATDPDIVRQVHLDYIRAGAEIIITNTFATGRNMLRLAGEESRTKDLNRQAARLALQAREGAGNAKSNARDGSWQTAPDSVWVAGSISPMSGGLGDEANPSASQMRSDFEEQAELLAESGVDFLILEMIRDIDFACVALEAATGTGLPVWVGFSCHRAKDGGIYMAPAIHDEVHLAKGVAAVMAEGGSLAAVMHSDVDITGPALEIVRSVWTGPTGAYPESGYFVKPNWQFVDIIAPGDFTQRALDWIEEGAGVVGGCCGIGPRHIRALAERLSVTFTNTT